LELDFIQLIYYQTIDINERNEFKKERGELNSEFLNFINKKLYLSFEYKQCIQTYYFAQEDFQNKD